jgi:regulator of replication initiation timing
MTAIKDVIDLIADLKQRVDNREFLEELRKIERFISKLHLTNASLIESDQALKTENAELKKKIATYEEAVLDAKANRTQSKADLDEMTEKMLLVIAKSSERITRDEAICVLKVEQVRGEYYFDQLKDRGFIRVGRMSAGDPPAYFVTPAGREYLVRRGLV